MGSRQSRVPGTGPRTRQDTDDARSTRSILLVAALGLQAAVWWHALAWYPDLPDRIPTHFDLSGQPDGFASKESGAWFLLPGVALGMLVLLGAASWGLGALGLGRSEHRRVAERLGLKRLSDVGG